MTEQTNWHDDWTYPTPHTISDVDADQWAELLNRLIEDDLDEEVIKKGPIASRPSAGVDDRWYLATDQNPPALYLDRNGAWVTIVDAGVYPAIAQTETITGAWTFEGGLDFKTYLGAIVWGDHPDFATAQAAIDYASTNGYVAVWFPPNTTYASIDIPNGMRVVGVGDMLENATVFDGGTTDHAVDMAFGSSLINCRVRTDSTTTGLHGVRTDTSGRNDIHRVICLEAAGDAFHIRNNHVALTASHTFSGQVNGDGVVLTVNSADCLVDSNTRMGTIVNNGTNNVVGDNT